MKRNLIDTAVSFWADRVSHARGEWSRATKTHGESRLPAYLSGEGRDWYNSLLGNTSLDERSRIALTVSWIYADIKLIASEFASAKLQIMDTVGDRKEVDKGHPFNKVLQHPNSEMDLPFLLQYMAYWLCLRGKAYWYTAPEKGNPDVIKEIWPIRSDRIFPVAGKTEFIDKYIYRLNNGQVITIDPRYVVFFRYPHPFDMWDGLSPLSAWLPVETERGLAQWQKDTYTTGRGIPHSVIALDKNLGETDFLVAAQRIREDFEQERKVAITRAGDLKVETVGISPKDLELIKSREFTRDEIDTIFLGVPIRDHASDVWLDAADKLVKEKTIWPLHRLIAGQLTVQVLSSFYGDTEFFEFEDIRPQDRSVSVQEANIYWRVYTVDEAREKLGLPKFDDTIKFKGEFAEVVMKNYGTLPVPLAIDPSFVTLMYDIGRVDPAELNIPGGADTLDRFLDKTNLAAQNRTLEANKPPAQPSLRQAESPKRMNNRIATQGTAVQSGKKAELQRWRKVALKTISSGTDPSERDFVTDVLSPNEVRLIKTALAECADEQDVRNLFSAAILHLETFEPEIIEPEPAAHMVIPQMEFKTVVDTRPMAEALLQALDALKAATPAPIIHVNVPEQQVPRVFVRVPPQETPNVVINMPDNPIPVVNVTVPEQTTVVNVPAAEVTVNVPEAPAPVVNVSTPRPEVNIQNEVNFPHEQTEETVAERDSSGKWVIRKTKRFG